MNSEKITISILEFDHHTEVLQAFTDLFSETEIKLKIFTTDKLASKIQPSHGPSLYKKSKGQSLGEFLSAKEADINSSNIILIETLHSKYRHWNKIQFKKPTILLVHNAHSTFLDYDSIKLPRTLFQAWKDFSHLARKILFGELLYKRRILQKITYFTFPSNYTTNYVISRNFVSSRRILNPPLEWAFSKIIRLPVTECKILIIGNIDPRRRDYKIILSSFKKIQNPHRPIELILLGSPGGLYGTLMIRKFKSLERPGLAVRTFDYFVPEIEFIELVSSSRFMVTPIPLEGRHNVFTELYGRSKVSGNVMDIIKYNLPALIPDHIEIDKRLASNVKLYKDSEHLLELLNEWIISPPETVPLKYFEKEMVLNRSRKILFGIKNIK